MTMDTTTALAILASLVWATAIGFALVLAIVRKHTLQIRELRDELDAVNAEVLKWAKGDDE